MRRVLILVIVGVLFSLIPASAQRFSISTDLLGYACLGTLNADVSMSVSQKWSIDRKSVV